MASGRFTVAAPQAVRHHYRACNLCEAICGLDIHLQGDAIQSIRGDKLDPFSRGYLCPKAAALPDLHDDPDRLTHPVKRTPTGWQRISWREAFDETAFRLKEIQRKYGNNSVATYIGNPSVHNYGTLLFLGPLLEALHSRSRFSASSLDQLPHMVASALMFGHSLLWPVPDIDRTDYFVIMGANPAVSNGSLMTAPDVKSRLRAIRERGGKVVVIDPRRTETARLADQHLFIRPGTDALLLLAVLNTLREEGRADPGRLGGFLDNLDVFWRHVGGVTPEMAEPWTGIDAAAIRALAREFADARSAVWYGRIGVCTQEFGSLVQWLIDALNIVTGNLDRPGGAMFTRPAVDPIPLKASRFKGFGRWKSRVRGLPEFDGELPTAVVAEEMLTPGEGQIKSLLTIAGNPVLSAPNGRQIDEALARLEFMVAIDIYVNETTRHAHIILPPTAGLEHEHYDLVFHLLAIRNTARFSPPLFAPKPDTRHDWEILLELRTRLLETGFWSSLKARLSRAVLHWLGPTGLLDLGLRLGPYGSGWRIWRDGLTLKRLRRSPHGIDLGPLTPCLPERLCTRNHCIEMAPQPFLDDLQRLHARFDLTASGGCQPPVLVSQESNRGLTPPAHPSGSGELLLIGRRDLRSNNSWMHNSERLVRGKPGCLLKMHPTDGARLGIAEGQRVRLKSRIGAIEVEVELTDEMMRGVVSLPHGWGHAREGTLLRTAQRHPGASINDVTDERAIDALSGNAAFSGTPVEVEPLHDSSRQ
jgi:anaerobic selenocysteine-containing dehydrogenase